MKTKIKRDPLGFACFAIAILAIFSTIEVVLYFDAGPWGLLEFPGLMAVLVTFARGMEWLHR